jgi:hypothetical protein
MRPARALPGAKVLLRGAAGSVYADAVCQHHPRS